VTDVGEGEEKENLTTLAERLDIAEHIEWHGYVPFFGRLAC